MEPSRGAQLPIAIVGAACRLPGAQDVAAFWDLLEHGRDAVTEIPDGRLGVQDRAGPHPRGGPATRAGGFLDDVDLFDAGFFGVAPKVAERLSPQDRLLLEVTWEAIEDAGLPGEQVAGSDTGVYVAGGQPEYWDRLRDAGVRDVHAALGATNWGITAGRIAHHLDLRGLTIGVEAACATSLVALHLAVGALRLGQVEQAVVGSANLLLGPDLYIALADAGVLAPGGRCRFGDIDADGFVRSEGVVVLVLKPLPAAQRDGDRVYATILGSAVNNNGRSATTMVALSRRSSEDVVRAALRDAGVPPESVDYVEAHGPGTPGGDATELAALRRVMAERPPHRPCLVGSVKSNLGHTEITAGLAGVLKTALALRHRTIPPTLHVRTPRPEVDDALGPVRLVRTRQPWPGTEGPAIAGVSSSGVGGVNVHVVLAEPPEPIAPRPARRQGTYVLPFSARSPAALDRLAEDYAGRVAAADTPRELLDLCFSAGARRPHHRRRAAVIGSTGAELGAALLAFARGERPEQVIGGDARAADHPRVAFLFSGNGSQWVGMGRSLMRSCPIFAQALRACSRAIEREAGWSLVERLHSDRPLDDVTHAQPGLWAMQVALAAVWREWGLEPDVVVGHSMGEVAAAVVSGALTIAQGAAVTCRRAQLIHELAGPGAMWAVSLGEEPTRRVITAVLEEQPDDPGRVVIAAVNGPRSCVLSGDPRAAEQVVTELRREGVLCRQLPVDYASHAPQIESLRAPLRAALADLAPQAGEIPLHSTVVNRVLPGTALDGAYWMENLRRPVRLLDAVLAVTDRQRPTVFLEISPHPLLLAAVEETSDLHDVIAGAVPSLLRDRPELPALLEALAEAYTLGCRPRWERVTPGGRYVSLPRYPWQRRRWWVDGDATPTSPARALAAAPEPAELSPAELSPAVLSPAVLAHQVTALVSRALGVPVHELDVTLPPSALGLDSLLAQRLSRQLRRELGVWIPVWELLGPTSLSELVEAAHARGQDEVLARVDLRLSARAT